MKGTCEEGGGIPGRSAGLHKGSGRATQGPCRKLLPQSWRSGAEEGRDSSLEPGVEGWAAPPGASKGHRHTSAPARGRSVWSPAPEPQSCNTAGNGLCQKLPQHHRRPSWSLQLPRNKLHLPKSGAWLLGKAKRTLRALKRLEQDQRGALRSRWIQTRMRKLKPRGGGDLPVAPQGAGSWS